MNDIFSLSNYTRSFTIENDNLFHGQDSDECPLIDQEWDRIITSEQYRIWDTFFKKHQSFAGILEYIKRRNMDDYMLNPDLYTVERYPLKKVKAFLGDFKCEWANGFDVEKLTEEEYYLLTQVINSIINLFQIAIFVFYDV